MKHITRIAHIEDIFYITQVYNEGIEDRTATLETKLKTVDEMKSWFLCRDDRYKVIVIEDDKGQIVGWASFNIFNFKECYKGVADISIYIKGSARGNGVGKILLTHLMEIAKEQGFYKVVLHMIALNLVAKKLYQSLGFREVGTYINQGILKGKWIDMTIMEKSLI